MTPDVSIVIPVIDEVEWINRTLNRLREMGTSATYEVIVADGNPSANTLRAITDTGIKKIKSSRGRGTQMNAGARAANGRILLFLHADTRLPEHGIDHAVSACHLPNTIGGAFDLGIDSAKPAYRLIEKVASRRSRLTRIPYGDQAIFITKKAFDTIGGFKEIPIMEDIDLMRRIKHAGYKICFIPEPVKTSPRRWENDGIVFCTLRNFFLSTLFYLGASPNFLKKYYL